MDSEAKKGGNHGPWYSHCFPTDFDYISDSPKGALIFIDIWVPNFSRQTPAESSSDGQQSQVAPSFTDM